MDWDDRFLKSRLQDIFSRQEPPPGCRRAILQSAQHGVIWSQSPSRIPMVASSEPEKDGMSAWDQARNRALLSVGFSVRR
jgi:hypothetical protein